MAFDGTLKFGTAIDQTGFKSGLSGLGSLASTGMAAISGAVSAAASAVESLGKQAVAVGAGFESSMAQVAATMGITKDTVQDGVNSFDLLSEAAEAAGANTTFSASEAAGALNYLALAGYDAATAAEALPAVLDLAAAGALDLQYASDLATDAMAALGIEANKENLTAFGDQMAKTASKANTSVAQLGEAILTVGGNAQMMAGGTEELNAALGVLANRGIKGSEGGTHLRNMLLSLSAPTDTAKETLAALGVSALDASGNMRPLNETFADLDKALQGMSDGDKSSVLSDLFNKTDLASAQAMLAGCGQEFDELKAAISDCDGAMSQMAATMNDTLEGDMKSLSSKAEALGIAVYEGMNSPLRDLAQTGGKYLSILTNAFQTGGLEGAAGILGNLLAQASDKLSGYLPELADVGARVLRSLTSGMTRNLPKLLETGREVIEILLGSLSETLPQSVSAGAQILGMIGGALLDSVPMLLDTAREIMEDLAEEFDAPEAVAKLLDAGLLLLGFFSDALLRNLPLLIETAGVLLEKLTQAFSDPETLTELTGAAVEIIIMLAQFLGDNIGLLVSAAITIVETLGSELVNHAPELLTAALELVLAVVNAVLENVEPLLEASIAIITALAEGLTDPEKMEPLMKAVGGILTKIFEVLCDAITLDENTQEFADKMVKSVSEALGKVDWAALGKAILDGIFSGLLGVDFDFYEYLDGFGENWVTGLKSIFQINSPSKLMRDQIGKNLALGIGEGFTQEMPDVRKDALSAFSGLSDFLHPAALHPDALPNASEEFRALRVSVDPIAVQTLREEAPALAAERFVTPAAAASYITNNYSYPQPAAAPERDAESGGGDIIIPVSIGGQQLDTIVIKAAQIANARSGGVTI